MSAQTLKVVVQGNCQAEAVARAIQIAGAIAQRKGLPGVVTKVVLNWAEEGRAERKHPQETLDFVKTCDLFVQQIDHGTSQSIADLAPPQALRISYPALRMLCLWPHATQAHPLNKAYPPHLRAGPYPWLFGDATLNRLMKRHPDPDEAFAAYDKIDPTARLDLDRLYELTGEKIRSLENMCGIPVWDFIAENFKKVRLFWDQGHPTWALYRLVLRAVTRQLPLGLEEADVDVVLRRYQGARLYWTSQTPIHPRIARHFGLEWCDETTQFRCKSDGFFTHREWVGRYLRYQFDEEASRGEWLTFKAPQQQEEGERWLRAALEKSPDNVLTQFHLVQNLRRQGRFAEAAPFAQSVAQSAQMGNDAGVHDDAAGILSRLDRLPEALAHAQRAVALDPDNAVYLFRVGSLALRMGDYDAAAPALAKASALDPYDLNSRLSWAEALSRLGRSEAADAIYEEAQRLWPDMHEPAYRHAVQLMLRDQIAPATVKIEQALAIHPDHAIGHRVRARLAARSADLAQAEASYRRSVEIDENDVESWSELTDVLGRLNRLEESCAAARRSLAPEPALGIVYIRAAQWLLAAGYVEEAAPALARAKTLLPDHPALGSLASRLETSQRRGQTSPVAAS